jgi:hypothetical protein
MILFPRPDRNQGKLADVKTIRSSDGQETHASKKLEDIELDDRDDRKGCKVRSSAVNHHFASSYMIYSPHSGNSGAKSLSSASASSNYHYCILCSLKQTGKTVNLFVQSITRDAEAKGKGKGRRTAMNTLNDLARLQVPFWHTTDAGRSLIVHVFCLDTSDAAELLVCREGEIERES